MRPFSRIVLGLLAGLLLSLAVLAFLVARVGRCTDRPVQQARSARWTATVYERRCARTSLRLHVNVLAVGEPVRVGPDGRVREGEVFSAQGSTALRVRWAADGALEVVVPAPDCTSIRVFRADASAPGLTIRYVDR